MSWTELTAEDMEVTVNDNTSFDSYVKEIICVIPADSPFISAAFQLDVDITVTDLTE
jgi:hypothetical protein